jgi:hypothetical protein
MSTPRSLIEQIISADPDRLRCLGAVDKLTLLGAAVALDHGAALGPEQGAVVARIAASVLGPQREEEQQARAAADREVARLVAAILEQPEHGGGIES